MNSTEMPLYQCHKQVRAAKITGMNSTPNGGACLSLMLDNGPEAERGTATVEVDAAWLARNPKADVGGYYVHYCQNADNYTAYSPAEPFEAGYTHAGGPMDFGGAVRALKAGKRVARRGWNGKGMWLALSPGVESLPAGNFWAGPNRDYALLNGGAAEVLPSITMKTADGKILMGWLASQSDILAQDWEVV